MKVTNSTYLLPGWAALQAGEVAGVTAKFLFTLRNACSCACEKEGAPDCPRCEVEKTAIAFRNALFRAAYGDAE